MKTVIIELKNGLIEVMKKPRNVKLVVKDFDCENCDYDLNITEYVSELTIDEEPN